MHNFLLASASGDSAEVLLDTCLSQLGEIPEEANVGFLYATDDLAVDLQRLLLKLKTHAPQVAWVGSLGMGLCSTGREYYDESALVMMIGAFPPGSFRILTSMNEDADSAAADVIKWWQEQATCFGLLHGDQTYPEISPLLDQAVGLSERSFLNGGLTSSDTRNYQIAERIVSGGLSGILFNEQVRVLTDHSQGCSPIGRVHELSESTSNIAISIDNRRALDVLKEDVGEVLARDLTQAAGYIFAALPIQGSDTGDYLVRILLGIDEENGVFAVGDYLDDQNRLMFCRRDDNSATDDMLRMLHRLKSRVGTDPIRGGVYISCHARGRNQFGLDSEELKLIAQELGEFPLVGFFANGEIYNGRLYGYTGVLTLFT